MRQSTTPDSVPSATVARLSKKLAAIRGDALRARTAGAEIQALSASKAAVVLGRLVRGCRPRLWTAVI